MNKLKSLTQREAEVLALVSRGWQNKEIARDLGIAIGTVGQHLKNIYGKLGVSNRTAAGILFVQLVTRTNTEYAVYTSNQANPILPPTDAPASIHSQKAEREARNAQPQQGD